MLCVNIFWLLYGLNVKYYLIKLTLIVAIVHFILPLIKCTCMYMLKCEMLFYNLHFLCTRSLCYRILLKEILWSYFFSNFQNFLHVFGILIFLCFFFYLQ